MKEDFSSHNNPSEGDRGSLVNSTPLFSRAKPRRIIITQKQFEVYFSSLVDITSESTPQKLIGKQKKLEYCMQQILEELCIKTSGGITSGEFNQLTFRNTPMKNKMIPNKDVVTRSIKNLEYHKILIKIEDGTKKKTASLYELGEVVKDILDPITISKMEKNRVESKKKIRFTKLGFDYRKLKVCPCCEQEQFITDFGIFEDDNNVSIIEIKPVCEQCQRLKHSSRMSGEWMIRFNSAWRVFYREINK